jgi:hypothetical protein
VKEPIVVVRLVRPVVELAVAAVAVSAGAVSAAAVAVVVVDGTEGDRVTV